MCRMFECLPVQDFSRCKSSATQSHRCIGCFSVYLSKALAAARAVPPSPISILDVSVFTCPRFQQLQEQYHPVLSVYRMFLCMEWRALHSHPNDNIQCSFPARLEEKIQCWAQVESGLKSGPLLCETLVVCPVEKCFSCFPFAVNSGH